MAKAFQKIYTKVSQITKATCSLKATGVGYDELATIDGKLAQVVMIKGDNVTLQVFEGTGGIPTNAEVVFLGKAPTLKVSDQLAGRFFNAYGKPIDGGPEIEGKEVEIGGPSVNPVRRKQPSELIATGIAGIDLNNTLVSGQKIPFFADKEAEKDDQGQVNDHIDQGGGQHLLETGVGCKRGDEVVKPHKRVQACAGRRINFDVHDAEPDQLEQTSRIEDEKTNEPRQDKGIAAHRIALFIVQAEFSLFCSAHCASPPTTR